MEAIREIRPAQSCPFQESASPKTRPPPREIEPWPMVEDRRTSKKAPATKGQHVPRRDTKKFSC